MRTVAPEECGKSGAEGGTDGAELLFQMQAKDKYQECSEGHFQKQEAGNTGSLSEMRHQAIQNREGLA